MPTTKVFNHKRYTLVEVTSTKRSANFAARVYRNKGYYVRLGQSPDGYWNVWARR